MRRVILKLGSSIVADPDGQTRVDVLARICDAVVVLHTAGDEAIIVTSGAIAHGVRVMGLGRRPNSVGEMQAASAVGQGTLHRVYEQLLSERGLVAAQILLTFSDMSARAHYLNVRTTLSRLLAWRVVPVVNENDTTSTDEISFGDNDFLAAQVAVLTGADLLILLTDIDGLYTADPRSDPHARLIEEVGDFADLSQVEIGRGTSPLGSGGMRSKVVAADMATAAGIPTTVCNGLSETALTAALSGQPVGTHFLARQTRHSSFKLWLKYAKPVRGTLVIDPGAARAIRESSASLLPVGIVTIRGDFQAGDAVEMVRADPTIAAGEHPRQAAATVPDGADDRRRASSPEVLVGKGICNYSHLELSEVIGMRSERVREILPRASEEVVHRDYMVLD